MEIFEAVDGSSYFTSQWYYRAEDTVIQKCHNLIEKERHSSCEASSTISCECDMNGVELEEVSQVQDHPNLEVTLLDLYSSCGAMSTGLCLGIDLFGLHFITRWAVNLNQYACESLKLNHPKIEVRNESIEDFLLLLEKWEKLCYYFSLIKSNDVPQEYADLFGTENVADDGTSDDNDSDEADGEDEEVFKVEKILGICYGDHKEIKNMRIIS